MKGRAKAMACRSVESWRICRYWIRRDCTELGDIISWCGATAHVNKKFRHESNLPVCTLADDERGGTVTIEVIEQFASQSFAGSNPAVPAN